jgi:PAS domain S-box-containing protein
LTRWYDAVFRGAMVLALLAGYAALFLILHPLVGDVAFTVGFIPTVMAAALFGIPAGVGTAVMVTAVDVAIALHLNVESPQGPVSAVMSLGAKLVLVGAVGVLRRLWVRLREANRALDQEVQLRRQVAAELNHSSQLHHTLVQSLGEGVGVFDAEDRFVFANAAAERLFSVELGQLVGQTLLNLADASDAPVLQRASAERVSGPVTYELKTSRGRHLLVTETAVHLPNHAEKAILRVMRDMTEHRRLEAERRALAQNMQRSQAMQSLAVLAGGVAHDFNNLLTGVLGNAELALLRSPRVGLQGVRECLTEIQEFAREATELSKQMLAYAGKGALVTETLDVCEVTGEALRLVQATVSARARLVQAHASDLPTVRGDRTQLRQVLVNLVMNAVESLGEERTTVHVSTTTRYVESQELAGLHGSPGIAAGEYVVLSVRDSGCGMSPATQDRVFEPFFSTKVTGRGMGLAATLGMVCAHGGAIGVESTPGAGSTFRIFLPANREPASRRSVPPSVPEPCRGSGTILVIDDERAVRSTTSRILGELGYRAVVAETGLEGLSALASESPAVRLVMLDLTMAGMDGRDTLVQLRKANGGVPVLLMSGFPRGEVASLLNEPGVVGFLQKPIQLDDLCRTLRRVFST